MIQSVNRDTSLGVTSQHQGTGELDGLYLKYVKTIRLNGRGAFYVQGFLNDKSDLFRPDREFIRFSQNIIDPQRTYDCSLDLFELQADAERRLFEREMPEYHDIVLWQLLEALLLFNPDETFVLPVDGSSTIGFSQGATHSVQWVFDERRRRHMWSIETPKKRRVVWKKGTHILIPSKDSETPVH